MSKLLERLKDKQFRFIIPTPGKCFKSKIDKKNKVLLLVLNKGYIEADDIETCYYITVFLDSHRNDFFVPVGDLDKVKLNGTNKIVYRQRVYFKSFATFLKVMKELNASIVIPDDFRVTTNTLMTVIDDLPYLEIYARNVKSDVNTWLTQVCKILIYEACKKLDMLGNINLDDSVYKLQRGVTGYLDRAPLLCGSYSVISHTSSVFRVEDTSNTCLFSRGNEVFSSELSYGYTDSNLHKDKERGVFKVENKNKR